MMHRAQLDPVKTKKDNKSTGISPLWASRGLGQDQGTQ